VIGSENGREDVLRDVDLAAAGAEALLAALFRAERCAQERKLKRAEFERDAGAVQPGEVERERADGKGVDHNAVGEPVWGAGGQRMEKGQQIPLRIDEHQAEFLSGRSGDFSGEGCREEHRLVAPGGPDDKVVVPSVLRGLAEGHGSLVLGVADDDLIFRRSDWLTRGPAPTEDETKVGKIKRHRCPAGSWPRSSSRRATCSPPADGW